MTSIPKVVVTLAAVASAALLTTGCASASPAGPTSAGTSQTTSPPTHAQTSTVPSAPQVPTRVYLTTYSNNDGPTATAVLTGAIGDYGKAISVHPDGSTDPEHDSELELALASGSLRLNIAGLASKLAQAFETFPSNITTCSGLVSVTETAPIVAGEGTGLYRAAHGSFDLTVTINEVDAKAHCGPTSPFLAQTVITTGIGQVWSS